MLRWFSDNASVTWLEISQTFDRTLSVYELSLQLMHIYSMADSCAILLQYFQDRHSGKIIISNH
jgi:hypothetical protein